MRKASTTSIPTTVHRKEKHHYAVQQWSEQLQSLSSPGQQRTAQQYAPYGWERIQPELGEHQRSGSLQRWCRQVPDDQLLEPLCLSGDRFGRSWHSHDVGCPSVCTEVFSGDQLRGTERAVGHL